LLDAGIVPSPCATVAADVAKENMQPSLSTVRLKSS
jgi:hypothetical protein